MANQHAIARAASGLESLARAVREARRTWDAQTKQLAVRAVDDLKIFVRRAGSWTDADTAKAEALGEELDRVAGRPSAQVRAAEALGLDAGARAFVAREGAAIASALDRAAQALRANPTAHDPLQHVLRALQPLRGLAALADLPPLPDLLEGIERSIAELERSGLEPPAHIAERFRTAATASARPARDVAARARREPRRRVRGGAAARGRRAHALELRRRGGALRRARSPDRADPRAGWPGCDPDRADRGARGRPGAAARAPASRTAASAGPAARAAPAPRTRPAHRAPRGPAHQGRSGRTGARDAGPRRLVGGVPTAAARRHRPRIARGADRRPGRAGRAAGGVAAGGRCPHAVVPRRPGAQARAGAARRGAHRVGRFAPGPRRRSLRPRCPRFRAQPRPVAAHPPRAGRGSWGSRSRSGCSRGRCTVWTQASWWDTCGAPTHCCCSSPWRWRR